MMLNGDLLERRGDLLDFVDQMIGRIKGYGISNNSGKKMNEMKKMPC